MKPKSILILLLVLILVVFRTFLGIQINFSHEDYEQIYLMGLENALSAEWSYWGPDVVWSKTRLAGALQGLLIGLPLKLFRHAYAPIVFSNLITASGLLLLSVYAKKRFPKLSITFLILLLFLLPFYLFHGVVLLNTAYLILSGSVLFISVFELFIYRDNLLLKSVYYYYVAIGAAMLFTYQLHLTWIMFLPFVAVLLYLEAKNKRTNWLLCFLAFTVGCCITGITLLPTIINYYDVIYSNAEGNLTFKGERFLQIFDVFIRYMSFSTLDVTYNHNVYKNASDQSPLVFFLLRAIKVLGICHFIFLVLSYFKVRKNKSFQKIFLLFCLTLIMATFLYILSNKHLSLRTYVLLYPIPLWMSFYAYEYWVQKKWISRIFYGSFVVIAIAYTGVTYYNFNGPYSFYSVEKKIKSALEHNKPSNFAKRRKTIMDGYK